MSNIRAGRPGYDLRRALRHLRHADRNLAAVISVVGPCRLTLRSMPSPFAALMRAITYQQLSGKAAATILGRVLELFPPGGGTTPEALLDMPHQKLRGAGLSRNKLLSIRDLAVKSLDGTVPGFRQLARMSDEEIIERLTEVRGIGRWTAEMLLIFNLGRPDVLPVSDLGIRKGFQFAYGMKRLPALSTVERAGRAWAPYRSIASWYLWRATEIETPE